MKSILIKVYLYILVVKWLENNQGIKAYITFMTVWFVNKCYNNTTLYNDKRVYIYRDLSI